MKSNRSCKSSGGGERCVKPVSSAFLQLLAFYLFLISVAITIAVCSYKLYSDSWQEDFKAENFLFHEILDGISQEDVRILEFLRTRIQEPSQLPYNWSRKGTAGSGYNGVNTKVRRFLGSKEKGFFVEASAGNGEYGSNTRVLEVKHGWTGLLVEAVPEDFAALREKQRKALHINACLSPYPYPCVQEFTSPINYSISEPERSSHWEVNRINCFSLYSLLVAAGRTEIDYLSLRADGKELDILKTIPFHSVVLKVISAPFALIPEGGDVLKEFLASKGYVLKSEAENQFIFMLQSADSTKAWAESPSAPPEDYEYRYSNGGAVDILGDPSLELDSEELDIQVSYKDEEEDDDIEP